MLAETAAENISVSANQRTSSTSKNPAFHVGSDSTHVMASAWQGGKGVVKEKKF